MKKLFGVAYLLSTTTFLVPGAARAQEAGDTPEAAGTPESPVVEEIIVTAQKRSENIQSVPIAVTAFTGEALSTKLVDDAVDLSFSVPNLTVTDNGNASLRGVGNLAISSTAESGLAYHVNGVYIGSAGTESEYYDVARIEVLRGPQGTLYGRNSTAGVLNVITQGATQELGGYVDATYGNYDTVKLRGAINLPITADVATRLAGFLLDRKGYTRNIFNDTRIDDRHMFGLRSSTRFGFGDTSANLVLSYFEEDDRRANVAKGVCTKDPVTGCSPLSAGFETPDTRTTVFNTLGVITGTLRGGFGPAAIDYFAGAVNPADLREVNQDVNPEYFVREYNASLEIRHDFGDIALTSLSGYQQIRRNVLNDFDRFAPGPGAMLLRPITFDPFANGNPITTTQIVSARRDRGRSRQYYQELRAASSFAGPFNFLLGANYYNQRGRVFVSITHPTLAARQQQRGFSAPFEAFTVESNPSTTKSYGLFGEAYFNLGESTRLTGGIRYSHDKKTIQTRQVFLDPLPDGSVRPFTTARDSTGTVTGRAVIDHRFTDRVLGYASLSRGYKAGGLNPGGPAEAQTFKPEFLNAAELGLKATTPDGIFRANVAGFYYDYSDLQIGQVGVTSAVTVNSDARVYGAEAELLFRPARALQFDATLSYLNTSLKDFQSGDEGDPNAIAPGSRIVLNAAGVPLKASSGAIIKNLDGNRLPFSPKTKFAFGAQYAIALGGLTLTPRIDYYRQGGFFGTEFNKPSERFNGYDQTDLKLLLVPAEESWQLRGFVKNLFDNNDITRITQDSALVGRFRGVVVLEPRTYGLEASYRF